MKYKILSLLIIAFSLSFSQVAAQKPVDAGKDIEFQISFADGKDVYRIGEPIKLSLSYAAAEPGYIVEQYYSPRFDDVIISPTDGVFDWLNRLNRLYSYDDVSSPQKLSETPVKVEITLNNLVRFDKPGKYLVKVVSRRVWQPSKKSSFRSYPVRLSSNELKFEIKEMSEPEESAEVERLTNLMDSAATLNQHSIYKRDFDYLTGDISTAEKVRRFLDPPVFRGVTWLDSGKGLDIARNKKLAVKMLEDVLRDPNREVSRHLIREIVGLRLLLEDEKKPSRAENYEQLRKEREPRLTELSSAYYAELLASLADRTGRSRMVAAYTIFTSLPKDDVSSAAYITTRNLLAEKFDELTPYERVELLDRHWEKIKSPALVLSLEKILYDKEPVPAWHVRDNALKRLIELDGSRARPFVIGEIRDPDSFMSPEILVQLDDKTLPEADAAILEQISNLVSTNDSRKRFVLQFKLTLAARYATDKIYKDLLDVYKKYGFKWSMEQAGPLLSYLAKYNDKEAIPLIEERINRSRNRTAGDVFYEIVKTNFTKGMEKLLQAQLESDYQNTAASAAYYLSKYGGKENKNLIEKRYNRWLDEWRDRAAELENPNAAADVKSQPMFQINMLNALIRAEKWKLPETETNKLKRTCLTEDCRRRFSFEP